MTCVVEFNMTTSYIMIFQNKYTDIMTLFICYIYDMIFHMYSKISHFLKTNF